MSANNWTICPRCKARADATLLEAREKLAAAYGKVPRKKWEEMAWRIEDAPELEETLREDYHIGIDEDGEFAVEYRGSCQRCGLEFSFEHKQKVNLEVVAHED